jgi:polyhydroxyalkanoate synthesis regulator phasin
MEPEENQMTDMATARAIGAGIAGDAVAAALLDLMAAKGIISRDEARGVLEDALHRAAMYTGTFEGDAATKIIGRMLEAEAASFETAATRPPQDEV